MIAVWIETLPVDTMESITERALARSSEDNRPLRFEFDDKVFEASPGGPGMCGTITLIAEWPREEFGVGGNCNDFPWIDKGRSSRESNREKAELEADRRAAEYAKIEMIKAQQKAEQQAIRTAQAQRFAMKARSLGTTSLSEILQWNDAQQQAMENLTAASPIFSAIESTAEGRNAGQINLQGIQQAYEQVKFGQEDGNYVYWYGKNGVNSLPVQPYVQPNPVSEADQLRAALQTVERVLGRHLREQLAAAPSSGSVYAQGPGYAVTAFEIRQVVQALDAAAPSPFTPPFWMQQNPAADFEAVAEDGEKIVLSKDGDRFDSGVLFDPSNRPIRKFKLKELAA